jgi:hypothetical protein
VLRILPNAALVAVLVGLPKLGWLKRSNTSVRNCRLSLSVIFVFFTNEKSVFTKSGPGSESRPALPGWHVPGTIGYLPGAVGVGAKVQGTANAAFGVVAQSGIGGVPSGVPANGSHKTALL